MILQKLQILNLGQLDPNLSRDHATQGMERGEGNQVRPLVIQIHLFFSFIMYCLRCVKNYLVVYL